LTDLDSAAAVKGLVAPWSVGEGLSEGLKTLHHRKVKGVKGFGRDLSLGHSLKPSFEKTPLLSLNPSDPSPSTRLPPAQQFRGEGLILLTLHREGLNPSQQLLEGLFQLR
jgi:hypothetical protein